MTSTNSLNPIRTPTGGNPTDTLSYLALGDSYTIGQSVGLEDRFAEQTVSMLRRDSVPIKNPQYIATTGWTTAHLMQALNMADLKGPFNFVSLLIGVNDQYQGLDTVGYRTRFTQLLNKAIEFTGNKRSHVFVLSIPDYSVTPFVDYNDKARVSKEIDEFNVINKEITLKNNVAYIDITAASRDAANNLALVAGDGLHPSGLEYKKWAEKLFIEMKKALQQP